MLFYVDNILPRTFMKELTYVGEGKGIFPSFPVSIYEGHKNLLVGFKDLLYTDMGVLHKNMVTFGYYVSVNKKENIGELLEELMEDKSEIKIVKSDKTQDPSSCYMVKKEVLNKK